MGAVLFDMDGVLVDSERHWHTIEAEFLKRFVPSWDSEAQSKILGMSVYQVYELLKDSFELSATKEEFLEEYKALSSEIYSVRSTLNPGVIECLERLQSVAIRMAIVSSAPRPWIDIVVNRFELGAFFEVILSSDDVNGVGKPHPAIYQAAVASLAMDLADITAIEDSPKGITSAKAAGLYCVAFRNGFNCEHDLSAADIEFASLAAFSDHVLEQR